MSQREILAAVARAGELEQRALVKISPTDTSSKVSLLRKKGYLTRREKIGDRQTWLLSATQAGLNALAAGRV